MSHGRIIPMRIALLSAFLLQSILPAPKPGHATILASPTEVNGAAGAKLVLFVDVALDCGFGDVSNFMRAFRAEFGVTPRGWRDTRRADL